MQNLSTELTVTFEELFKAITYLECHTFEDDVEYFQTETIEIKTQDGFAQVNGLITKSADIVHITLANGAEIRCADMHILFDENGQKYAKDLQIHDSIEHIDGFVAITDIEHMPKNRVYDLEVANESHTYITANGVKHHNTSITASISHIYSQSGHKVITIVPSSDLVDQTATWYDLLGMDTGIYSGESKDIDHANVVATWQAIQYNPGILSDFSVAIWDECVHPDTLIDTAAGKKPIKEVQIGELVYTLNEDTLVKELKPVKKVFKNMINSQSEKRFTITLDNGEQLTVTGNHKILTTTGWKRADALTENDELV